MLRRGRRSGSWGCSCRTLAGRFAFSYRKPPPISPDRGGFFTPLPLGGGGLLWAGLLRLCQFFFRQQRHANTNDDEQTSSRGYPTKESGSPLLSGGVGGGLFQSLHQSVGEVLRQHHTLGVLIPALQGLAQSLVFIIFLLHFKDSSLFILHSSLSRLLMVMASLFRIHCNREWR